MTLLSASAAGCCPIVLTDVLADRLEFAKSLVPDVVTVQVERCWTAEETAAAVKNAAGQPVSLVMECTGLESSITAGIYVSQSESLSSCLLTDSPCPLEARYSSLVREPTSNP